MEADNSIEFGWAFYLVIIPLILTILVEIIKVNLIKIKTFIYRMEKKVAIKRTDVIKMRSWAIRKFLKR